MLDKEVKPVTETDLQEQIELWLKTFPTEAPLVMIPAYNAYEDVMECVDSIMADKTDDIPLLVVDDASPDDRIEAALQPLSYQRGFLYVRKPANSGFVGSCNLAYASSPGRDVIIVNSDLVLPPRWIERLRAAAYHRTNIATATPLTNNGTIVSIPYRNTPIHYIPGYLTVEQADRRIEEVSKKLRPVLPTAIGHCVYIKRAVLDTIGFFDKAFAPGYGEEVDFSQRAIMAGFCHVVADDVFVFHKGSKSFGKNEAKIKMQQAHEELIRERYPWYHAWVGEVVESSRNPLATVIETARAALLGYRVAIDATCLSDTTNGTQVHVLELINALSRNKKRFDHLAIIINDSVAKKHLLGVDEQVDEVVRIGEAIKRGDPFDLVYRPFQIYSSWDIDNLAAIAKRYVIQQLDFIAYSNPSYFANYEIWSQMRYLTQLSLLKADGVVFNSHDVAHNARHHGFDIPAEQSCVGYAAANHELFVAKPKAPAQSKQLANKQFILVIGTNFKHKNRAYSLRLLKALIENHGWDGQLVFAGLRVGEGGSSAEEALETLKDARLRSRLVNLGPVNEEEKAWLLEKAALVLYPSLYEGFGLVPLEAGLAGTPALTTPSTSLVEVLGSEVAYLDSLDPNTGAKTVWQLLTDETARQRQVELLKKRAELFTWENIADRTWDFLKQVITRTPKPSIEKSGTEIMKQLDTMQTEYAKLERWAAELNNSMLKMQQKPAYKVLSRFRLM